MSGKRQGLRVRRGQELYPYTTGEVVEALQGAGVLTDEAIRIARDVEKRLRQEELREVALDDLMERLAREVEERVSPEIASRVRAQTPPFVPMRVLKDGTEEPYSRRTLVQSLEKLELSFKEAFAVARQVELGLRMEGFEVVREPDLLHVVALALEARYGRKLRLRYEADVGDASELRVLEPDGLSFPYSRGILARSLMSLGLGPELSHQLSKRVEDRLWRQGPRAVSREEVRSEVMGLLQAEAGEEFARRYLLLRELHSPEHPLVVLLGGAPGVGKSSIASELGYRLGVPRIVSTDSVRQALRSLISRELAPVLHASSYTAWRAELLPAERQGARPKRKRVVRGFQAQVQQLGTALAAIVERNLGEATSLVMEGIHLVPGVSPAVNFERAVVVELVFAVEDEESHRRHFGLRERQTDERRLQQTYLDHFEEIRILQDYITERARQAGAPVIEATDFDQAIEKAMEHILNSVLAVRYEDLGRRLEGELARD